MMKSVEDGETGGYAGIRIERLEDEKSGEWRDWRIGWQKVERLKDDQTVGKMGRRMKHMVFRKHIFDFTLSNSV